MADEALPTRSDTAGTGPDTAGTGPDAGGTGRDTRGTSVDTTQIQPRPLLPAYGGACLDGLVPALIARHGPRAADWLPEPAISATQVVLLVLDGLGWEQLQERRSLAPNLLSMTGRAITSVAPTTTATALTSITTGLPPAAHGIVGYRVVVFGGQVMNVLKWRTAMGDALRDVSPVAFQPTPAFAGTGVPVVTRAEFEKTGFTAAHLAGAPLVGWRVPSSIPVEVRRLLNTGSPFVYAYYDGIDKVAHECGLGEHFDAELVSVDRLVGDLAAVLPPGAALVVSSDHGQVQVGDRVEEIDPGVLADVAFLSGEGRFRWLHARSGVAPSSLADKAAACHGHYAWIRTREETLAEGWFGGAMVPEVEERLGDVAIVAYEPVAFLDPADIGELALVARHGSLTPAEMLVPLLAGRA